MSTPSDGEVRRAARRIAIQTTVLILTLFTLVGGAFFAIYDRSLDAGQDKLLANATSIDRPEEAPPGVWVAVVHFDQTAVSSNMPAGLPDTAALSAVEANGGDRSESLSVNGHHYLLRTARVGDHVTQAIIDRQQREEEEQRVIAAVAIAGLVAVILAGLASALLARRAVRPLSDALDKQRRFVADASHELRTPLTHLSTRVQMLGRRDAAAVTAEDLDRLHTDTNVLAGILDDLLAATDTRRQPRESVRLDELVTACVDAASPHATRKGIDLVAALAHGPAVDVVPVALRRAVTALIDNAIDHASAEVVVALSFGRRSALIEVTDDGPGIEGEVMPRIFERFGGHRVEGVPDPDGRRHFGIGLALVADVAAAHGGAVDVVGRVDGRRGSTFRLRIPR